MLPEGIRTGEDAAATFLPGAEPPAGLTALIDDYKQTGSEMFTDKAPGSTVYVTLEPCSHTGLTPPCCEALAAAGVG
jgi:pyrimidine deaminase RibD-like protein